MVDPMGLAGETAGGLAAMQDRVDAAQAGGTGVRLGGANIKVGKADLNVGGKKMGSKTAYETTLGKPCAGNEESVGLVPTWAKKWWNKTIGGKSNNVSVTGASVAVDPICVDPGQVVKNVAAGAVDGVVHNSGFLGAAVQTYSNPSANWPEEAR
jgi:hypothetical protein